MATKRQREQQAAAIRDRERADDLRARYQSQRCVCGKPKQRMEPFCKRDMGALGKGSLPRPQLRGDVELPSTAEAYEVCVRELARLGYVLQEVQLGA